MNSQHRTIRTLIRVMSPRRAEEYIKAFGLPENEEKVLILCDVKNKSYIQVAYELHVSPEYIKRARKRAFAKIADDMNHRKDNTPADK